MAFREKIAWLTLVTMLVAYGAYSASSGRLPPRLAGLSGLEKGANHDLP